MTRYRFGDFVLSPSRRTLLRSGRAQPLIPRYFDLLVFLVERRERAVHRREIFDAVWSDVVVSDSALSQAIRTIRRVLDDDSRDPRFIRTVSRHGYQFVYRDIVQDDDAADLSASIAEVAGVGSASPALEMPAQEPSRWEATASPSASPAATATAVAASAPAPASSDPFMPLIRCITSMPTSPMDEEEQRDAAERLHALGTAEALRRIDGEPRAAFARALLRDTRWDVAEAGPVPILGTPHASAVAWQLVRLRIWRFAGVAASRWEAAAVGSGCAGALAGAAGGSLLVVSSGNAASPAVVPVLATIGAGCGAVAGAGIGAGLALAETVMRSKRPAALVAGGAIGGGLVGLAIQLIASWTLAVLVGITPPIGGGLEGLAIGAAVGAGYAIATRRVHDGLAAPRGADRVRTVALTAAACALAGLLLALSGRSLAGGTVNAVAQASAGSQALLAPLGRLIGEPGFGPLTAALISMGEGAAFGVGLALGLTRRRRSRTSHETLTSP